MPHVLVEPLDNLPDGSPLDGLQLVRLDPDRYPCWLESTARGTPQGRYSLLLGCPVSRLALSHTGQLIEDGIQIQGDFLDVLASRQRAAAFSPRSGPAAGLPFLGGWAVFFSYEFAQAIEPACARSGVDPLLPVALALRCTAAIIQDHQSERSWLVAEERATLDRLRADIALARSLGSGSVSGQGGHVTEEPDSLFLSGVHRIRDWIGRGDVYQVNLSRGWDGYWPGGDAVALHARLRSRNPAPFSACFHLGGNDWIVSASPERLVQTGPEGVETRPIAGTWPRPERAAGSAETAAADDEAARALRAHPKERAEHVMLIDLERNDLGRVCKIGSIHVDEFLAIESYPHVHHLVSSVRGELASGRSALDLVRAVFPGGTITGCPKIRCMQLIAALEDTPRGAYTGSLGYLSRDGRMDLNILIRSMTLHGEHLTFRTGAGIVADSDPERELAETRAKARGLLAALE